MPTTFDELLTPTTATAVEQRLIDMEEVAGLPITAWQAGGTPRTLLQGFGLVIQDVWVVVPAIAKGGVLGTRKALLSAGAWLTAFAKSAYDEDRKLARSTIGRVTLVDHGGGPHNVIAGETIVGTATGLRYRIQASATLPLNGTLVDLPVQADGPGARYNVGINSISQMVTTLPTVTVSNPDYAGTGTWVTTQGLDDEGDPDLTDRLPKKWPTLSTGSPVAAYEFWALSFPGVTRVKVDKASPDGPGTLRVYIDSPGSVAALQAFLQQPSGAGKVPTGAKATVIAATSYALSLSITVYVERGHVADAKAGVEANLAQLALDIGIGGTVIQAEIIQQIMSAPYVTDEAFSPGGWAGSPNIVLPTYFVMTFDTSRVLYIEV